MKLNFIQRPMLRLAAVALIAMTFSFGAFAQKIQDIKRNPDYIYSEATAPDARAADSLAIISLSHKIAATVDFPYPENVKRAVAETYFDDVRREAAMIPTSGVKKATSLRYIRKDQVERIFSSRRRKVLQMRRIASSAQEKLQMDVALRYWSWSSVLLKSLLPVDAAAIAEAESRCDAILSGLNVAMSQREAYGKGIVELKFTFNGSPVQSVDYRFFDGSKWSGVLSAKDGLGFIEVSPESKIEDYLVRYEVDPSHLQHIYRDVENVEKALGSVPSAVKTSAKVSGGDVSMNIGSGGKAVAKERPETEQKIDMSEVKKKVLSVVSQDKFQSDSTSISASISPVVYPEKYITAVQRICRAVENRTLDSVKDCFTEEGWGMFLSLMDYGKARVLSAGNLQCYALGDEVYCRSVPMAFSFTGNARRFVENVVFTFDSEGLVSNLSFALASQTVRSIISQDSWSEEARIILVTFLENYKTAYALKRLDYISSIFDEDALIITGHVLRNTSQRREYARNPYVVLTRQSKRSYIERLGKVFAAQEFINIQFTDCKVMKLGKGEQLYGIQIRQEYYSTTYADTGYLFILVDLSDYQKPVIHVRTWQEAPDEKFGIIGPYNF